MLVPLYGFVEGDTMGVLVLAEHAMPLRTVVDKLRASASVRVATDGVDYRLVVAGEVLADLAVTVEAAGLTPLSRIDLRLAPASEAER